MSIAAERPKTQETTLLARAADFRELWGDLLDESEKALEENDLAWYAVVHRILMPVPEREVLSAGSAGEAPAEAA